MEPSKHPHNVQHELHLLLDGLAYVEAPRWHDGRLWFSHWGRQEILAVDLDGTCEVVAPGPPSMGWATARLPDGQLLVTGETLQRQEADGSFVQHADLTGVTGLTGTHPGACDEIVVDGHGNIYVNTSSSTSSAAANPTAGSSRSSPRTAPCARWRASWPSPTGWSSRPTTPP